MARQRFVTCDHCGEQFPAGRLACPECGSDAATGWKDAEAIDYASVEIPDCLPDLDAEPEPAGFWTPERRWFSVVTVIALIAFALAFVLGAW